MKDCASDRRRRPHEADFRQRLGPDVVHDIECSLLGTRDADGKHSRMNDNMRQERKTAVTSLMTWLWLRVRGM